MGISVDEWNGPTLNQVAPPAMQSIPSDPHAPNNQLASGM